MVRGGQAEKNVVVALLFDSDLTAFGSFTSNSLFALLLYIQLFVCLMFSLLTFANEEIVLSGFAEKKHFLPCLLHGQKKAQASSNVSNKLQSKNPLGDRVWANIFYSVLL